MTTRARRMCGAVVALVAVAVACAGLPSPSGAAASPTIGVTRSTVTVAGLVGADPASVGADIGAQARFARANRRGGVAGRAIRYAGNAADPATAASSALAVVPAVSDALDASTLAQIGMPFIGSASTTAWDANRLGFGFVGAQATLQTRVVSSAWGRSLRSLLGTAEGSQVALAVDDSPLGAARATQARISLRAAGFRVSPPVVLPAPPAPLPDLAPVVGTLATGSPAVVLLLTSPPTTVGLAQRLAQSGFTGTVAADGSMYQPTAPAIASGLTVLVPYAPFEQPTAANRRLAADVEAFAPGTKLTPGIAAGYWSADLFVAMLTKVRKHLTRPRFLAVARRFAHEVPATVGAVRWPAMRTQGVSCGALVQSDGDQYLVVERYTCGRPIVVTTRRRATTTTTSR